MLGAGPSAKTQVTAEGLVHTSGQYCSRCRTGAVDTVWALFWGDACPYLSCCPFCPDMSNECSLHLEHRTMMTTKTPLYKECLIYFCEIFRHERYFYCHYTLLSTTLLLQGAHDGQAYQGDSQDHHHMHWVVTVVDAVVSIYSSDG